MKTAFKAMQLGFVKYFIPFFFVLNPAILLQGSAWSIFTSFVLVCCSVISISYSLEGYLPKFGVAPLWLRATLFLGGICLGLPWQGIRAVGGGLILIGLMVGFIFQKRRR
jgi:TRAP-type uncharacterized transport system fused permease subunit